MTLLDIALKNVTRDWRTYALHFANCLFSVTVFFLFSALAFHPQMSSISMASTLGLLTMLASGIVAVFALGFVSYSQGCFLKARSKQFGLMPLIGMSKRQRRRLVLAEGGVIAAAALVGGSILGLVLLKLFLTVASLVAGGEFDFYLPFAAFALTVAAFVPIFAVATLTGLRAISRKHVIELLAADQKDEKVPKLAASAIAAVLFAAVAAVVFPIASNETGIAANLTVLGCTAASLVCLSFFVMQGILAARKRVLKASGAYYRGTHMLASSLFESSARSNLQSMTLSSVLYAAAFLAVAVLVAVSGNAAQTAREIMPYALTYTAWNEDAPEQEHVEAIRAALDGEPGLAEVDFNLVWADKQARIALVAQSDYNRIAELLGEPAANLANGEVLSVATGMGPAANTLPDAIANATGDAAAADGAALVLASTSERPITTAGLVNGLFVVGDDDMVRLFADAVAMRVYAFEYDSWTEKSVVGTLDELTPFIERGDVAVSEANLYYTSDKVQFGMMLYLAAFVSIVFILAIASFSYSRLHARAHIEGERFAAIAKLGLSRKELSRLCVAHAAVLLLMPFALGLAYLWIGSAVIQTVLSEPLLAVTAIGTVAVCAVELAMWTLVSRSYAKEVVKRAFA